MQGELFKGSGVQDDLDKEQVNISACKTLDALYKKVDGCSKCGLSETCKSYVFGDGNRNADLLMVGEAPGADEDEQGKPFVGRSGQLLTKIINAIEIRREDVYIANILKCRPPGNRTPSRLEVELCMPYLKKQIDLVSPKIVLALGRVSANALLQNTDSMAAMRGKTYKWKGKIDVVVTYHPAALLRNPLWKKLCWEDMKRVKMMLNE